MNGKVEAATGSRRRIEEEGKHSFLLLRELRGRTWLSLDFRNLWDEWVGYLVRTNENNSFVIGGIGWLWLYGSVNRSGRKMYLLI